MPNNKEPMTYTEVLKGNATQTHMCMQTHKHTTYPQHCLGFEYNKKDANKSIHIPEKLIRFTVPRKESEKKEEAKAQSQSCIYKDCVCILADTFRLFQTS